MFITDHDDNFNGYVLKNGKFLFIAEDYIPGMTGESMCRFVYTLCDKLENDGGKAVNYNEIKDLLTEEDREQHLEEIAELNNNNLFSAKSFNI